MSECVTENGDPLSVKKACEAAKNGSVASKDVQDLTQLMQHIVLRLQEASWSFN